MPATGIGSASLLADHIRQRVRSLTFAIDSEKIHLSISVGVAESAQGMINLVELISAADTALYMAKSKGRNRVQTHSLAEQHLFELSRTPKAIAMRQRSRSELRLQA
jgi:diguanylate cyclase (GGDEF)-like protein